MKKLPSISIITITYNPDPKLFEKVLKALKKQTYPKKLIEHLVIDGGSTNNTAKLARKYKCKVVVRPDLAEGEQERASIGFKMAKGDIILIIQSDNIVTTKDWLYRRVQPFIENKKLFFTFSMHNSYMKGMDVLTRYCALFGLNDPTVYYLNKQDTVRLDQKKYNKGEILKETKDYYIVKFTRDNLPTLGDNGHMFLRSAIKKLKSKDKDYMHTDAIMELLDYGYNTFGVVKNSIIHVQKPDLVRAIKRRVEIKEKFYDKYRGRRKYAVYNPNSVKDRLHLVKFIIFSTTFIVPLFESIRGYIRIRDSAWFLHPVMCLFITTGFAVSEIKFFLKKLY